jgi:hypothetical protein
VDVVEISGVIGLVKGFGMCRMRTPGEELASPCGWMGCSGEIWALPRGRKRLRWLEGLELNIHKLFYYTVIVKSRDSRAWRVGTRGWNENKESIFRGLHVSCPSYVDGSPAIAR